jgi:hypothetical protein
MAKKNHMLLVLEIFNKYQHGKFKEDINVKDKQNFRAIQQIAFPKVRKCLETIDEGMQFFRNMSKVQFYMFNLFGCFWKLFMVKNSIKLSGIIIVCGAYDLFWN